MDTRTIKKYNRIKLIITFLNIFLNLAFWLFILFSGISHPLAAFLRSRIPGELLQFYLFVLLFGFMNLTLHLPLSFYSGYIVEHRFSLSNQTLLRWFGEQLKGLAVGLILGGIVLTVFYFLLSNYPRSWWIGFWLFVLIFSILLTRVAPVVIFPLFYKFTPLENLQLRDRISRFARRWNMNIRGIFQFNLGKDTRKANAAFAGLGKSKRVLLSDTLVNNFSEDEIEAVFAHEIGHYQHHHLWKGIFINSVISFIGLYLVSVIYRQILQAHGWPPTRLEALPYLGFLLFLYGLITGPLGNLISRRFEYQADRFAAESIENPEAFKNALLKLSELNLADPEPHPVIEFLFYSHPSIQHRIEKITGEKK